MTATERKMQDAEPDAATIARRAHLRDRLRRAAWTYNRLAAHDDPSPVITAEDIQQHLDDLRAISSGNSVTAKLAIATPEVDPSPPVASPEQPSPAVDLSPLARVTAERDAMRAKLLADLACDDWTRIAVAAAALKVSEQCIRNHSLEQEVLDPEMRGFPVRRVGKGQKIFEVGMAKLAQYMAPFRAADVAARQRRAEDARKARKAAAKHRRG